MGLFITTFAWAIPEDNFETIWKEEALPYFDSFSKGEGQFYRYYFKTNPENKKVLVIMPGRTEPAKKYAELVYDLRNKGLDLFVIDHRGQGSSPRQIKDPERGYVNHFNDYVKDFTEMMNKAVLANNQNKELYLLAHSMGGAIAVKYLAQHPNTFNKIVLSAPMLQINTAPYSETVAYLYAKVLVLLRKGADYAPGSGPYIEEEDTFENNRVTSSIVRFNANKFLYTDDPHLLVWSPTVKWVFESLKATKHSDQLGHKIESPILLLNAENDQVVKRPRQESFCLKANCEFVTISQSQHEILMEKDTIRDEALARINDFFNLSNE